MPFKAPSAQLERIRSSMLSMVQPGGTARKTLLFGLRSQLAAVLKREFTQSVDPDGNAWQQTVRGKPALVSKKLPNAFTLKLSDDGVAGVGSTKRDLLTAHQEGHVFKSRHVADRQNILRFNKKGKLVKQSRFAKLKGGRAVFAHGHNVGQRTLPARKIIPEIGSTLPQLWDAAVKAGLTLGLQRWRERMGK